MLGGKAAVSRFLSIEKLSLGDLSLTHVADRTSTDICALLPSGFPRQSATFVKIAGVRMNSTIPDVYSLPLGGGSRVRDSGGFGDRITIGPDSVGHRLEQDGIYFGGNVLTVGVLILHSNTGTRC